MGARKLAVVGCAVLTASTLSVGAGKDASYSPARHEFFHLVVVFRIRLFEAGKEQRRVFAARAEVARARYVLRVP